MGLEKQDGKEGKPVKSEVAGPGYRHLRLRSASDLGKHMQR